MILDSKPRQKMKKGRWGCAFKKRRHHIHNDNTYTPCNHCIKISEAELLMLTGMSFVAGGGVYQHNKTLKKGCDVLSYGNTHEEALDAWLRDKLGGRSLNLKWKQILLKRLIYKGLLAKIGHGKTALYAPTPNIIFNYIMSFSRRKHPLGYSHKAQTNMIEFVLTFMNDMPSESLKEIKKSLNTKYRTVLGNYLDGTRPVKAIKKDLYKLHLSSLKTQKKRQK